MAQAQMQDLRDRYLGPQHPVRSVQVEQQEQVEQQAREQRIERQQVQWVFGLTGGELADTPWQLHRTWVEHWAGDLRESSREQIRYWYDEVPDYAESDFRKDLYRATYRTAVLCCPGRPCD